MMTQITGEFHLAKRGCGCRPLTERCKEEQITCNSYSRRLGFQSVTLLVTLTRRSHTTIEEEVFPRQSLAQGSSLLTLGRKGLEK
jgi:hypothetical protein